jgi:hypothetical protein
MKMVSSIMMDVRGLLPVKGEADRLDLWNLAAA